MHRRAALLALAIASTLQTAAAAVDFSFNGFATAGYAQTDTDRAVFGASTTDEGIDDSGTSQYDSMLGVQGTVKFGDDWTVTAQGLVRQQPSGEWEPDIDWAYVSWQPLSSVRVRAGLTRVPTFMFSDSVFLGYANTWVRPPHEIYGLSPIYLLEGVDVVWTKNVGPVQLSVQPYFGNSNLVMPNGESDVSLDVKDWYGMVVGAAYGSFTVRAGYGDKTLEEELPALVPLVGGINSFANSVNALGVATNRAAYVELAQQYRDVAKQVGMNGNKTPIFNLGVQYDDATNFATAEYATRGSDSISVAELTGMYVTAGRRFGSFSPYVGVAAVQVDSPRSNTVINAASFASLPAGATRTALMATAASLGGFVNALAAGVSDQETLTAGLRYEVPSFSVVKGAVVKFQFDHINPKDGGRGFFQSADPGFSDDVNMYSFTFDFVF